MFESEILPLANDLPDIPINNNNDQPHPSTPVDIHPSKKNHIPQIFFATHNINGLRNDSTKLDHLLTFTAEHNIDIIALTETNLHTAKFIDTGSRGYTGFWNGADDKIKGSGVGILIADHLAQYVHKVDKSSIPHYLIKISLCFKGCYLQIYSVYCPPTDRAIQQSILNYIKKEHSINRTRSYYHTIVMGDFNSVVDSSLDKYGNSRFYKQPSALINFLQNNLYVDTFRFLHPHTKAYSWLVFRIFGSDPDRIS